MTLEFFTGTTLLTKVLFYVALAIVGTDLLATIFTIIYQRIIYTRVLKPRYDESYNPQCSILVPCKGIPKDFEKNLRGFLEVDYKNYEVIYVTESENDAAVPVIKSVIADDKRARHVVAGLAKKCAQKNHNLVAAYGHASKNSEVIVFADSDIKPAKNWLIELIHPLADKRVTVTSGFRWLFSSKGNVGEMTHSYVNIFIYIMFTFACFFGGVGLWGGSMAIRRKDFDDLDVANKWLSAAVDDMCLSQIVLKSRKKAVLVPRCVTHSDDLIQTVYGTIRWFERQMMYLKNYQRPLWLFVLPLYLCIMFFVLLLPVAFFLSLSNGFTFAGLGGGAALTFYIGEFLTIMAYPLLGAMPKFHRFVLFAPFIRLTHVVSYLLTWTTNTVTWAGIKYLINSKGEVLKIERPDVK